MYGFRIKVLDVKKGTRNRKTTAAHVKIISH
jgi:hypothetical protein